MAADCWEAPPLGCSAAGSDFLPVPHFLDLRAIWGNLRRRDRIFFLLKRADQVAHLPDGALQLALVEKGGAADKGIRAGTGAFDGGVEVDASVDFDVIGQILFRSP